MIGAISLVGDRLDLDVRQGASFGPIEFEFKNPDGTPVDLTGSQIIAQIRKLGLDTGTAPVALTATITAPTLGQGTLEASAAAMNIACGEALNHPDSHYVWDMLFIDAAGRRLPCNFGDIRVLRGVSKL